MTRSPPGIAPRLLTKDLGQTNDDQPEKQFKPRFFILFWKKAKTRARGKISNLIILLNCMVS